MLLRIKTMKVGIAAKAETQSLLYAPKDLAKRNVLGVMTICHRMRTTVVEAKFGVV